MLGFLVWASADIGSNVYLKTVCRGNTEEKSVAITFDDGPHEYMTPRVLDVLKKYDVKATFFLIGKNVEKNHTLVKRIVSEGHLVGNHTYLHKGYFPMSGSAAVKQELESCNNIIESVTGKKTKLFRPPFGVTNPIIGRVAKSMGFSSVGWSIRSLDTLRGRSRKSVCDKVLQKLHNGAIILLHDRCGGADELLDKLLPSIIEKGYKFITVDKILQENVYEN